MLQEVVLLFHRGVPRHSLEVLHVRSCPLRKSDAVILSIVDGDGRRAQRRQYLADELPQLLHDGIKQIP